MGNMGGMCGIGGREQPIDAAGNGHQDDHEYNGFWKNRGGHKCEIRGTTVTFVRTPDCQKDKMFSFLVKPDGDCQLTEETVGTKSGNAENISHNGTFKSSKHMISWDDGDLWTRVQQNEFEVGERVEVRDHPNDPWIGGVVVTSDKDWTPRTADEDDGQYAVCPPGSLRVRADGFRSASCWKSVRSPVVGEKAGKRGAAE